MAIPSRLPIELLLLHASRRLSLTQAFLLVLQVYTRLLPKQSRFPDPAHAHLAVPAQCGHVIVGERRVHCGDESLGVRELLQERRRGGALLLLEPEAVEEPLVLPRVEDERRVQVVVGCAPRPATPPCRT